MLLLPLLFVLLAPPGAAAAAALQGCQETAASEFFQTLDGNKDGEIDEQEARKYIGEALGGSEFDTLQKVDAAVDRMKSNVDGADPYATISKEELQQHLKRLMQGGSVAEWVRHGLGLPHLESVFRRNAITALDFPLLLEDKGAALTRDMQVSKLQKAQIVRGLQLLILGIGELPPDPEDCTCAEASCDMVSLNWKLTPSAPNPPVLKCVVEQQSKLPGSEWKEVYEVEVVDGEQDQFHVRLPFHHGEFHFRIASWSAYGRSEKVEITKCLPSTHTAICSILENKVASSGQVQESMKSTVDQNVGMAVTNVPEDNTRPRSFAGLSTILVLLLTIGVRFLHSRHFSFARCLTFCGLSFVAKILHHKHSDPFPPVHSSQDSEQRSLKRGNGQLSISSDMAKSSGVFDSFNSHSSTRTESPRASQYGGELRNFPDSSSQGGEYPAHGVWGKSGSEDWGELATPIPAASWEGIPGQEDGSSLEQLNYQHAELVVGQCSFDGCKSHWRGFRQLRKRLFRHFCGICQLSYCANHTRISPHGPLNSCGQQSRCVCVCCFESLTPERQRQLEKTHRQSSLPRRGSRSEQNSSKQKKCLSHKQNKVNEASQARALRNWARASWKVRAVCNFKQAGKEIAKRRQQGLSGQNRASDEEC